MLLFDLQDQEFFRAARRRQWRIRIALLTSLALGSFTVFLVHPTPVTASASVSMVTGQEEQETVIELLQRIGRNDAKLHRPVEVATRLVNDGRLEELRLPRRFFDLDSRTQETILIKSLTNRD